MSSEQMKKEIEEQGGWIEHGYNNKVGEYYFLLVLPKIKKMLWGYGKDERNAEFNLLQQYDILKQDSLLENCPTPIEHAERAKTIPNFISRNKTLGQPEVINEHCGPCAHDNLKRKT